MEHETVCARAYAPRRRRARPNTNIAQYICSKYAPRPPEVAAARSSWCSMFDRCFYAYVHIVCIYSFRTVFSLWAPSRHARAASRWSGRTRRVHIACAQSIGANKHKHTKTLIIHTHSRIAHSSPKGKWLETISCKISKLYFWIVAFAYFLILVQRDCDSAHEFSGAVAFLCHSRVFAAGFYFWCALLQNWRAVCFWFLEGHVRPRLKPRARSYARVCYGAAHQVNLYRRLHQCARCWVPRRIQTRGLWQRAHAKSVDCRFCVRGWCTSRRTHTRI